VHINSQRKVRAGLPPMGWNSWDCFGSSVTEAEVMANARFMAQHLLPYGWDTVVVDIQWYEPQAGVHTYQPVSDPVLDQWGKQLPAPGRFPSAADGSFRELADRIHDLGLRFGLHMMRGIPRKAVELDLPVLGSGLRQARRRALPTDPERRDRRLLASDRAVRTTDRPEPLAGQGPVPGSPGRARAALRDVADLRRPVGRMAAAGGDVPARRPLGAAPAARRLGRRGHVAPGTPGCPCARRPGAGLAAHAGGARSSGSGTSRTR
jgi:hypothetical protein